MALTAFTKKCCQFPSVDLRKPKKLNSDFGRDLMEIFKIFLKKSTKNGQYKFYDLQTAVRKYVDIHEKMCIITYFTERNQKKILKIEFWKLNLEISGFQLKVVTLRRFFGDIAPLHTIST
jgi:hypothetical protein